MEVLLSPNRRARIECSALVEMALALSLAVGCHDETPARETAPEALVPLASEPTPGNHYARTAWATLHRDSSNSDYVPLRVTTDVEVAWTALDGAALLVGPVLGPEGHVYVTSGRGRGYSHLHAFDRGGRLLWQTEPMRAETDFDFAAAVCAPIVDTAGFVYAADSNQLWSFSPSGDLRWVVDLPDFGIDGYFVTPLFTREGFVGGVSTDGKVGLFQREDGRLARPVLDLPGMNGPPSEGTPPGLWEGGLLAPEFVLPLWDLMFGREIEVANTPAVHPETGRIFITAAGRTPDSGVLYGIDTGPSVLRIAFEAPMGAGSGTSPALSPDGSLVFAIDDAGLMVALDSETGERVWETADTMGQASPSVGPDGRVYSFNGIEGTIVAIDGASGDVVWRRQYDALAEQHLSWRPFIARVTTVDGIITITDSGLLAFFDLNYEIPTGDSPYPQPQKVIVGRIDPASGDVLGHFEARDTSGALVVPDSGGRLYLTLSGAASSIAFYGVNPLLPGLLQVDRKPLAGIVALDPRPLR